jgi:hypothetical protein
MNAQSQTFYRDERLFVTQILVPGSGLGRLPLDLALEGYDTFLYSNQVSVLPVKGRLLYPCAVILLRETNFPITCWSLVIFC